MTLKLRLAPDAAWRGAIDAWEQRGDRSLVLALLEEDGAPIPPFARRWLAAALAGKVRIKRGRRPDSRAGLKTWQSMQIAQTYQVALQLEQLLDDGSKLRGAETPHERALRSTADRHGITPAAVQHILHPRKRKAHKTGE